MRPETFHLPPLRMRECRAATARPAWAVALAALLISGCALPQMARDAVAYVTPARVAPAVAEPVAQAPAEPPPAPAPEVAVAAPPPEPPPARIVLDYADRVARMPGTILAQEIAYLGQPGNSVVRQMQLAIALAATGVPSDAQRARELLNRIAHDPGADDTLRPLARLLLAHQASLRRTDELIERQNQQLRDAQRRIEQLNDRLEAVRAVERSMSARRPASAPSTTDGRPAAP